MFLNTIMAFEIMLAYVTLVLVNSFHCKFGEERPGSLVAVRALAGLISIICMLPGTFKVGENVPACGTFICDHQRFGWITQSMNGPLMLAQRHLSTLKVTSVAILIV